MNAAMIRSIFSLEASWTAASTPSHAVSTSPTLWPKSAVSTTICTVSPESLCAVQACLVVVILANGVRVEGPCLLGTLMLEEMLKIGGMEYSLHFPVIISASQPNTSVA